MFISSKELQDLESRLFKAEMEILALQSRARRVEEADSILRLLLKEMGLKAQHHPATVTIEDDVPPAEGNRG